MSSPVLVAKDGVSVEGRRLLMNFKFLSNCLLRRTMSDHELLGVYLSNGLGRPQRRDAEKIATAVRDAVCARGAALAKASKSRAISLQTLKAEQLQKLSNNYRTQLFKLEQAKFQAKEQVKMLRGEFAQRLSSLKGASPEMQEQLNELMAWVRNTDDDASESEESEEENIDESSDSEDDVKRKERHDERVLPRAAQTAAVENMASTSGVDVHAPAKKQRLTEVPLEVNPSSAHGLKRKSETKGSGGAGAGQSSQE